MVKYSFLLWILLFLFLDKFVQFLDEDVEHGEYGEAQAQWESGRSYPAA